MEKVIAKIKEAKKQNNLLKAVIGLEPSGHYWKASAHYLSSKGYKIALVNPYHIKKTKELDDNRQIKNDSKGPLLIAKLVRGGDYFDPNMPSGMYADIRRMYRLRLKVKKSLVRQKTALKILLDEYFCKYEEFFSDILGTASEYILRNYFLPQKIASENILFIVDKIKKLSRGRIKIDRIIKVVESSKRSIGITAGLKAAILEKTYILDEIKDLKGKLIYIDRKLKQYLDKIQYLKHLLSIPGVGTVTAAGFLGEIGDISRYASAKEIIKLAGLNLVEMSSGQKNGKKRYQREVVAS